MRKHYLVGMLSGLFFALIVSLAGIGTVQGQIALNRDSIKIESSGFPAHVQKGYRLFGMKCNECHGIETSLKPGSEWTSVVKRMQAMASSHFNDAQAKVILDFLNYYEANRKSLNPPAAQAAPSGTVAAAGKQFYDTQGCAECHAIGGKGGTSAPSLSDVGKRLPKDKLTEVIQGIRTGKSSMPPLPKETTDQQVKDLIDFLTSLNSEPEKQDAGAQKKPEAVTDQGSKPTAQAGPSGTVAAAGQQFYDTQGCAKCHAIGGKGSTSGPSLSDVGKRLPKDKLTEVIQGMRTGKSSMPPLPKDTTEQQVKGLIDYLASLNGDSERQDAGAQKKPESSIDQGAKLATQAAASGAVAASGRQFYDTQGCAKCHAIGGKGGTSGPSLSDVGKRLPKDKLTEVIQGMRTGKSSMPPLASGTTDQQATSLIDFLMILGGEQQKQSAGKPKKPETKTTNKPGAQAAALGSGGDGRQFYDTQGCAKCHAISGKGGTSAPSLSDVGKRLSKDQLTEVIQKMRTGKSSMPPLPATTTDPQVKSLVAFLVTLNDEARIQNVGVPKQIELSITQGSRGLRPPPIDEIVSLGADTSHGATALPSTLLLILIAVNGVLIGVLVFRPGVLAAEGGKILAFFGLFLLPLISAGMGTTYHVDRSKSTKFCMSCHEMEPYGKSLLVDDPMHLAADHFQNHRVPANEACYTCHTNYAMFGSLRAKIGGLKHVYVHYLGKPPAAEAIRLYEPFNNRECLHCHLGARSFEEGAAHNSDPYLLPAVKGNQVSCLSCHQTVHDIAALDQAKLWKGNR